MPITSYEITQAAMARINPTPRNLAHIHLDTGYRWTDADPIVTFLRNDITDSGWSTAFLAERADVSCSTVRNIRNGRTRHPQNRTVDSLLEALGWHRPIIQRSLQEKG